MLCPVSLPSTKPGLATTKDFPPPATGTVVGLHLFDPPLYTRACPSTGVFVSIGTFRNPITVVAVTSPVTSPERVVPPVAKSTAFVYFMMYITAIFLGRVSVVTTPGGLGVA